MRGDGAKAIRRNGRTAEDHGVRHFIQREILLGGRGGGR